MNNSNNDLKRDFSIIFNEIEKHNNTNSQFTINGSDDEKLRNDESIRTISEICHDINNTDEHPVIYLTFS